MNKMAKLEKKIVEEKNGRVRVQTINKDPSVTQQQFKEQVDINNIVAKYMETGEWSHITRSEGAYADVSEITDYHESLDKVLKANEAFGQLPAHIRARFKNDPAELLEFIQDSNNYDEAVKLGLIEPKNDDASAIKNDKTNQKTAGVSNENGSTQTPTASQGSTPTP